MSRTSDFEDYPFSFHQTKGKHMDFLKNFFTCKDRYLKQPSV